MGYPLDSSLPHLRIWYFYFISGFFRIDR